MKERPVTYIYVLVAFYWTLSMTSKEQVRQLKKILDALVKAEKEDNDTAEIIYDTQLAKIKEIPKENIIAAIKEAIGDNSKRKNVSAYVFSELYDLVGIDTVFEELLISSDPEDRNIIVQSIRLRRLRKFVPILNSLLEKETNNSCKHTLIYALGELADESSFAIFLRLTQQADQNYKWRLVWAFKNFAKQEGKQFLEKIFSDKQSETSDKVVAAWGLVKIGDKSYYDYLLKMLDDPDVETTTSYSPGQSMRAAQAICDINKWDFVWNKDFVAVVKERLKNAS